MTRCMPTSIILELKVYHSFLTIVYSVPSYSNSQIVVKLVATLRLIYLTNQIIACLILHITVSNVGKSCFLILYYVSTRSLCCNLSKKNTQAARQ
jgi:hypothetical protein